MPLYEYTCTACDHRFEILQPLGAQGDELACPDCDHAEVARNHSTFAASSPRRAAPAASPAGGCCMGTAA